MFIAVLFRYPKGGSNPVSTDRWVYKQNIVYTHNGILFSLENEGNSDTCYNMDGPEDNELSEISQ